MAQSKKNTKAKGRDDKKLKKKSAGSFFGGIKQELKRVTWPDRPTLKKNTVTVLAIIISAAVIIFVFDHIVQFILDTAGFYRSKQVLPAKKTTEQRGYLPSSTRIEQRGENVVIKLSGSASGSEVL